MEKLLERWPMDVTVLAQALVLCEFRTYKCQEHLQYAQNNEICPIDAIKQNKKNKLINPVHINLHDLITEAQEN